MARVVQTNEGLVVRQMGYPGPAHEACAPSSWCQPPDVALAALQKEQPLPQPRR